MKFEPINTEDFNKNTNKVVKHITPEDELIEKLAMVLGYELGHIEGDFDFYKKIGKNEGVLDKYFILSLANR